MAFNVSVDFVNRSIIFGSQMSLFWVPLSQAIVWGLTFATRADAGVHAGDAGAAAPGETPLPTLSSSARDRRRQLKRRPEPVLT